jgi:Flp pilus assembly protein TadB
VLSDRERNVLHELERRLAADDPAFVRAFTGSTRRLARNRPHRRAARTAIVVAVLFGGFLLLAGSPGAAIAVAGVTGLVWLAWRTCPESGHWEQSGP